MSRLKSGKEIIDQLKRDMERYGVQCDKDKPCDPAREMLLSSAIHDSCVEAIRHLEFAIGHLPAPKARNLKQQRQEFRELTRRNNNKIWEKKNRPQPS